MKYVKEELENYIYIDKKSYKEIGRIYGVSDTYIKKIAIKLGIPLPRKKVFPEGFIPANKGKKKHNANCVVCKKDLDVTAKKFCSIKCESNNRKDLLYKDYLENTEKYCRANYSMKSFKPIFLKEQQHKCAICGIDDFWNKKTLVFVLDHIDGNAANNKRDNIRLVCPNCDSQLDTYKSKNKNSARKERYLKNYKN